MMDEDFEAYVKEILDAMPKGLTLAKFLERCKPDLNGGSHAEVKEAVRRYFKKKD